MNPASSHQSPVFFFYDLLVALMVFGMRIGAWFNEKLREGVVGRRESFQEIRNGFSAGDEVIWMHAASLGEYLQGLPVLEGLKRQYPEKKVLITFFSPSGYKNAVKKDRIADVICYLPFDRKRDVERFCSGFHTSLFFTVKYDYWYRLFDFLNKKRVPVYVVSALFYKKQIFFKAWGKVFVRLLKRQVTCFFHQTAESLSLAQSVGLTQSVLSGDTRFDRVKKNVVEFMPIAEISEFVKGHSVLVVGSSWQAEENIVFDFIQQHQEVKVILAPHDLKRIPQILSEFTGDFILFSQLLKSKTTVEPSAEEDGRVKNTANQIQLLIIDNIGMLSKLYHYATVALVGGGFHSAGLHNILEAAAFGVPVIFGNHYHKNPEADALIEMGGGKGFAEPEEAERFLNLLFSDSSQRMTMAKNAADFIQRQTDATKVVLKNIEALN